jgi:hypothetical protein
VARRSHRLAATDDELHLVSGSGPRARDARISRIAPAADPADVDPNHHLWRNGRLWWIAFTVHRGHLQERVRFSLGTDDVEQARRRRDEVLASYEEAARCRISLRLKRPASAPAWASLGSAAR